MDVASALICRVAVGMNCCVYLPCATIGLNDDHQRASCCRKNLKSSLGKIVLLVPGVDFCFFPRCVWGPTLRASFSMSGLERYCIFSRYFRAVYMSSNRSGILVGGGTFSYTRPRTLPRNGSSLSGRLSNCSVSICPVGRKCRYLALTKLLSLPFL
jgi:hypothetical protein